MEHYRRLEGMYAAAPINRFYQPTLDVSEGRAEVTIEVGEHLFHSAMAMHGSVYFKMLDDAAWFAANSVVLDVFVLTTHFDIELHRPVSSGRIRAVGIVEAIEAQRVLASAELFDERGKLLGRGSGRFAKSARTLSSVPSYRIPEADEASSR